MTDIQTIVDNRLKAPQAFFKWAKTFFPRYEWANKQDEIISTDRTKHAGLIRKRLTKKSRLTFVGSTEYFVWMGITKKRIEMQMYQVTQILTNGKEDFDITLFNFYQLSNNKHIKAHYDWYNSHRKHKDCYQPGYQNQSNSLFEPGAFGRYYMYQSNDTLCERLQTQSELRYITFDDYLKDRLDIQNMLPHLYKYRDRIEYAQKIQANGIYSEMVGDLRTYSYYGSSYYHEHANMNRLTMRFLKENKPYLKNTNIPSEEALFNHDCRKAFNKTFPELYAKLEKAQSSYRKSLFKQFMDLVPKDIKPIRFMHWFLKQDLRMSDYQDYLNMLDDLGLDSSKDYLAMPKDWEDMHTNVVLNHTAYLEAQKEKALSKEDKALAKKTAKRLKTFEKAQTSFDQYTFKLPESPSELTAEGKILGHCVGSYTRKHFITGETTIVFVRDNQKPNQPLYTMEIKDHHIVQLRGENNHDASSEAWKEAKQFITHCDKLQLTY